MKFLGKTLLTLLLLFALSIVLCYAVLQTSWAAGWLSRWVSNNSGYHLSLRGSIIDGPNRGKSVLVMSH